MDSCIKHFLTKIMKKYNFSPGPARLDPSVISKSKKGIIYTLIAFLMISMAEDFSEIFRMGNSSKLLTKQGVQAKINLFEFQVELFLTFIYYIVGCIEINLF